MTQQDTSEVSSLPDVALIPDPGHRAPGPLDDAAPIAAAIAARAAATIESIGVYDGRQALDQHLGLVSQQLDSMVDLLPTTETEFAPPGPPIHEYFRVRSAPLDALNAGAHALAVIRATVVDLRNAPLSGSDLERLLKAIHLLLLDISGEASPSAAGDRTPSATIDAIDDTDVWTRRWIVAHQLHALLNIHAAFAIQAATRRGLAEGPNVASTDLTRAAVLVAAFAPCRAYALTFPSSFYSDVLRRTMEPPFTTVPLNGRMHPEYRFFREAVADLLARFPASIVDMAQRTPAFAFAREELLNADLIDAERHVTLVEPIIGQARALGQPLKSRNNAMEALRSIRDTRARQFQPFMQFGDGDGA